MNLTSPNTTTTYIKTSTSSAIEPWYIPCDILVIICTILAIILSIILLFIIILDKTCHTVQLMLVANSYFTVLLYGCVLLTCTILTFVTDSREIYYQEPFCVRTYILSTTAAPLYYSFLLEAFYRYVLVVYPTRFFYQSAKFQCPIICLTWILGFLYPVAYMLTGEIIYDVNNQLCQTSVQASIIGIYVSLCNYMIPVPQIIFIYLKLIRYVKQISKRVLRVNTLSRAKSQLKMVRCTIILITILISVCFPLVIFMLMSFFTCSSKYGYRIGYVFIDISLIFVMIILLQFTDPFKKSLMKRLKLRPNTIVAIVT